VPLAHIWHKISPTAQADSPLVHYYMTRNRLLFLKTTGAGLRAWLHTLFTEYLRTLMSWSLRPRWRGKRAQRDIMVTALRDYFSKRLGKAPIG
jgi:GT2 family glycosyltransferase